MKMLSYVFVFVLAFLFVTSALIFMNQKYRNVFAMDFREVEPNIKVVPRRITRREMDQIRKDVYSKVREELDKKAEDQNIDSQKDDYKVKVNDNSYMISKLTQQINTIAQKQKKYESKRNNSQEVQKQNKAKQDSVYSNWLKSTVKLYESMEAAEAAKFIPKYSDNVARDLIYSMKQKKAADILKNLNPDFVINLTQAK